MHVSTAANSVEALAVVDSDGLPDISICDIVMPGMIDGVGLAKLRKRNGALPVLLMSGYAKSVDPSCTFLRKPFSVAELEQAITAALTPEPSLAVGR